MWMNTSAFKILSKLAWFIRPKLGMVAFLFAKPLGETKNIINKEQCKLKKISGTSTKKKKKKKKKEEEEEHKRSNLKIT